MSNTYTEDHLVEQSAIQLMRDELGWDVVNCYDDPSSLKLRRTGWEVVLVSRLRPALQRLNPDLPVDHSSPRLRMAGAIEGGGGGKARSEDTPATACGETPQLLSAGRLVSGKVHFDG